MKKGADLVRGFNGYDNCFCLGEIAMVLTSKKIAKAMCYCMYSVSFLFVVESSEAELISYTLNISSGIAHTSGGFSGNGFGDIPIEGSFKLIVDDGGDYAALEDIDISLEPLDFDWNSLVGTLSGVDLYLVAPNPLAPPLDYVLHGTFDGSSASLTGVVYDSVYDGYQYNCSLEASVAVIPENVPIPEPSTFTILGIGIIVFLASAWRRRR